MHKRSRSLLSPSYGLMLWAIESRCVMSTKRRYHTHEKGRDTAVINYFLFEVAGWEGLGMSHSLSGCVSKT